jgi:F0F1-type ATP synthase assembly protein I
MVHSGILVHAGDFPESPAQESSLSDGKLPNLHQNRDMRRIAMASSLGFGTALSLAVMVAGGVWLDRKFDTVPLLTLVGLALGLIAAGYQLYELALLGQKDRENGPIGRALERRFSRRENP